MMQAIHSSRSGGHIGYLGAAHDIALPGEELLFSHVHLPRLHRGAPLSGSAD